MLTAFYNLPQRDEPFLFFALPSSANFGLAPSSHSFLFTYILPVERIRGETVLPVSVASPPPFFPLHSLSSRIQILSSHSTPPEPSMFTARFRALHALSFLSLRLFVTVVLSQPSLARSFAACLASTLTPFQPITCDTLD